MIEVIIEDKAWRKDLPDAEELAAACFRAAAGLEPALCGGVALLLTGDASVRSLNKQFRNIDKPTNVLSFPARKHGVGEADTLGDIAIARETCMREAREKGASNRDYTAHLIIHGLLHLIGYDHQTDDDADDMERREAAILHSLGAANPYLDDPCLEKAERGK